MEDSTVTLAQQTALREISEKIKLLSPEFISTFPKSGQVFLRTLTEENVLPKDIRRQSSLFCEEIFNEKSGRNLENQDENTLALWMIGTLVSELLDADKMQRLDLFTAQKEKILDLLAKEPFSAQIAEVSVPPIASMEISVKIEPTPTPVSTPVKESILERLEKIKAEITEKAKLIPMNKINKVKDEITKKAKKGFVALKGLFRRKK